MSANDFKVSSSDDDLLCCELSSLAPSIFRNSMLHQAWEKFRNNIVKGIPNYVKHRFAFKRIINIVPIVEFLLGKKRLLRLLFGLVL